MVREVLGHLMQILLDNMQQVQPHVVLAIVIVIFVMDLLLRNVWHVDLGPDLLINLQLVILVLIL